MPKSTWTWIGRVMLLTAVVAGVAWALSYCIAIRSVGGRVLVLGGDARAFGQFRTAMHRDFDAALWHELAAKPDESHQRAGFELHRGLHKWERYYLDYRYAYGGPGVDSALPSQQTGRFRYWLLAVPYWPIVLTGVLLPALAFAAGTARAARRRALNLCQQCGYDLRATPGRCPECGTESAVAPVPGR